MSLIKNKLDEAFDKLYEFHGSLEPVDDQDNESRGDHVGRSLAAKFRKNGPDSEKYNGGRVKYTVTLSGLEPISNSEVDPIKLVATMTLTYLTSGGSPGESNFSGHPDTHYSDPGVDSDKELIEIYIYAEPIGNSEITFAEVEATANDWSQILPLTMTELSGHEGGDGMVVNGRPIDNYKQDLTMIAGE